VSRKSQVIGLAVAALIFVAASSQYSWLRELLGPEESISLSNVPHAVDLNWEPSAKADSYNIYRAPRPFSTYRKVGTSTTNEFLDFPISAPNTLYYKVTAVNEYGEGAPSIRVVGSLP
jgi:fibronectin type 3 domain-containing protein